MMPKILIATTCSLALGSAVAHQGVQRAERPTDDTPTVVTVPAPSEARKAILAKLEAALRAVPAPPSPYRPSRDGASREVGRRAGKLDDGRWAPVQARAERTYQAGREEDNDFHVLEVRVALNGTDGLSPGLASVGAGIRPFDLEGAVAFVQTMVGADDARVAVPLTDEEKARALTLVRVYIVGPDVEPVVRSGAPAGSFPPLDPTRLAAARPESVRSIVVELYGPKRDVEALARRVPIASLRKRLTT